jgi:hypothetical protein
MGIRQKITPLNASTDRSIGTLWTLARGESIARCVLIKVQDGLQLRVLLDDTRLRDEDCGSHPEAFELAERWRERMMSRGWVPLRKLASA